MEKNIIDVILELKIRNAGALNNVKLQIDGLHNSTTLVTGETERLGKAFRNLKIPDLNAILGVADRTGTLFANLSKEGANFGQSMANLSAKTGITGNALEALSNNARKVGKESGLGADAAASAYNVLASQLDVAAIGMSDLNNLQKQSITLAQASGVSIDVAASSMAASISQFGLSADEAGRVVNVLAAGSRFGAAGIEDLSQSFRAVGSTATDMGLTIEQSAGALEVLSKANLKGSEAGTALRDIITRLNTELNVDLSQISLSSALDALKPRLTDATYLSKVFGTENLAVAQYLIQNSAALGEMTQKVTDSNAAQELATIRTETTAFKMEELRAKVNDIKIGIADAMGPLSAYAAVISENAVALALFSELGLKVISGLRTLPITLKVAHLAQTAYNSVVILGERALYVYQMQILTARAAITATTGATKLMNMAIAASPYILAATAAIALGVAIYKIATGSSEAQKAQERMNDAMSGMQKEISTEQIKLDSLFTPLLKAKEGTEEWKQARDRVQETYGDHLKSLGIEEISVGNVRKSYDLLSQSIINTARARASEKALTTAGDELAGKEGAYLTDMRQILTEKYGETNGRRVFDGISSAIRSGNPKVLAAWSGFIKDFDKVQIIGSGSYATTTVSNPLQNIINDMGLARKAYDAEYKRITDVFGQPMPTVTPAKEGATTGANNNLLKYKSLTLAEINKEIESLQQKQQTASEAESRQIKEQINQLQLLKQEKEQALGGNNPPEFQKGSLAAMKQELSEKEKKLSVTTVGEASIKLKVDIENLKAQIENAETWIENNAFKDTYGEIKAAPLPSSPAGRSIAQMAQDFQNEDLRNNPDAKPRMMTPEYVKDMQLTSPEMPQLDPKKSGIEQWNEAVDTAATKNQDLIAGLGGVSSTMGSLGTAIGGAAGEWLNWGANVIQSVAAAIPQITTMLGLQGTQVTANTAVAGSGAAAAMSSIPIVGPILAVAAVASVLASLASLPKFANGALAYGPTMGLFGEYSGAQNNPEVIAPLSKLRHLIQPAGGVGGQVEFVIDGRLLRGVLNKVDRYNQRTR